jgi:hypothetical protein
MHDGVLAVAQVLDRCALIGLGLLTGVIAAALALAAI